MENKELNKNQVDLINHALGISQGCAKPFRNYFCNGSEKNKEWEDLCEKDIAVCSWRGSQRGGYFYHVSEKGLQFILENRSIFVFLDLRIKKLETLYKKVNK